MKPSVCVIIVNWNGWRDTIECLESLFRINYGNYRVVVCDNGSTDGSLTQIKAWADGRLDQTFMGLGPLGGRDSKPTPKPVEYVELDRALDELNNVASVSPPPLILVDIGENLGFAGGNNVGMNLAASLGSDYAWLLNNDTVVDRGALNALILRMQESPDAGMCGSTLLHYNDPEKVQAFGGGYYCKWIGLPWHQGRLKKASSQINWQRAERWMNYVVGASLLVSRKFITDVGPMTEDYFLYFEEIDWILRSKGSYGLAYAHESIVYHKVGGSIGTSSHPGRKSFLCDFYSIRGRLLLTRRYFPIALPSVCVTLLGGAIVRLVLGRWRRAWMILRLIINPRLGISALSEGSDKDS